MFADNDLALLFWRLEDLCNIVNSTTCIVIRGIVESFLEEDQASRRSELDQHEPA